MKLAVEIEIRKTGSGFELVNNGLTKIGENAGTANAGLQNLLGTIGRIATVGAAFTAIEKALSAGVRYNALLQSSALGLSAIIAQTADLSDAQGRQLQGAEKFNRATEIAVSLQKDLQQAALRTAATYEELLAGTQAALPLARERGFDTRQLKEFVTLASQAAAAVDPLLLKEGQFAQEIRGLFEGDLSKVSRLARIVFSDFKGSADDLKKTMQGLAEQGKLFDFFRERLAQFGEAGERSMSTFTVSLSNFKDAFQQAMGQSTITLTDDLTSALNRIVEAFTFVDESGNRAFRPELIENVRALANAVGEIATALSKVMAVLPEFGNALEQTIDRNHERVVGDLARLEDFLDRGTRKKVAAREKELRELGPAAGFTTPEQSRRALALEREIASLKEQLAPNGSQRERERLQALRDAATVAAQQRAALTGRGSQFMQQTAGAGGKLLNFPDLEGAGQKVIDLATSSPKKYTLVFAELKKAAADGTVTQIEYARAFKLANDEMQKGTSLGKTKKIVDEEAAKAALKAAEAEQKRADAVAASTAALVDFAREQQQQIAISAGEGQQLQKEREVLNIRAQMDRELANQSTDREAGLRRQIALQERLNAAEMDQGRLDVAQKLTAERFRNEEVLARIAGSTAKLLQGVERGEIKGSVKVHPDGTITGTGEAGAQGAAITQQLQNEETLHQQKLTAITDRGELDRTARVIEHTRQRIEQTNAMHEEQNRTLFGIYASLGQNFAEAAGGAFEELARGGRVQNAFKSLADGIARTFSQAIGARVAEWMDKLALEARGIAPVLNPDGTLATGADGKPIQAGKAPNRRAKAGYMGLAAAGALYGLYQSGKDGATPGQNAISGAASGAAIGAMAGPYGAIVGAVIGAVAGAFAGKNKAAYTVTVTNGKIGITGKGLNQGDINAALRAINDSISAATDSVQAIFDAFPKAIADSMKRLSLKEILPDTVLGQFTGGGGPPSAWGSSSQSILVKALYKKFRETKGMLSGDELKEFIENGIPQLVFDAYAPIFRSGLAQLGVTEDKLKELFAKEPGFDAKEALERIRGFVEVLVGFMDMEEFSKLSGEGLNARALKDLGKTPLEGLRAMGDEIKKLAEGFGDLTTDQQIARGKEILALEENRQKALLSFLYELKNAQDSIFKSINAQRQEIELQGLGAFGQRGALQGQLADVMGSITRANSGGELTALAGEAQGIIGRLFDLTTRLPAELEELVKGFKGLDDILKPERTPMQRLTELSTEIATAFNALSSATDPDKQITHARELLALEQERFTLQRAMLAEINSVMKSITESIASQVRDFALEGEVTAATARGASPEEIANIRIEAGLTRQRTLRDQLTQATTAQDIARIVGEMQQNAGRLFDLMGKTPEAAAQLTKMLEDVQRIADERLKALADAIGAENELNRTRISTAIGILEAALAGLPKAAAEAQRALDALQAAIGLRITQIVDDVAAANTDLLATVGGILAALRAGLEGIFSRPPTPPPPPGGDDRENRRGRGVGRGGVDRFADDFESQIWGQNRPVNSPMNVSVGQPVVYVNLTGSAEALIDSVVAEAEMRGAQLAVHAINQQRARRGGGW